MNRRAAVALLALALGGCSTPKKEEGPARPVRFAVIGAPEVGTDDADLALAVTKLSRETGLDFVLVPGPVLARDATSSSLELLREDLGQIAPPVYVGFAAVVSASSSTLTAEEILTALEKLGPGPEHAVSYERTPPRQPNVLVRVAGPDGKEADGKPPEGGKLITLGGRGDADLTVRLADALALEPHELKAPALSRSKSFFLVTMYPGRTEVQPVALEGPDPPGIDVRTE
jgi:hypothetical protein